MMMMNVSVNSLLLCLLCRE